MQSTMFIIQCAKCNAKGKKELVRAGQRVNLGSKGFSKDFFIIEIQTKGFSKGFLLEKYKRRDFRRDFLSWK